ncbi:hypothetical protein PLICRDRAFT_496497 [Plicaturopsis crispa FD-325 SS-3]|nr:hypothetical protein PLICRDRAFT_496497 [Plicaturopsis crispa FD-325 SS-3]
MLAHLQAQTEDMLTQMAGRAGNAMDAQLERVGGLYTARFLQEQERSTAIGAQLRSQWGALSAEFGLMHQVRMDGHATVAIATF